jgi:uncharacterized protein (TIGR02266 family)
MGASSAVPAGKKTVARVALVDLDRTTGEILRDCFKQFSIEAVPLVGEQAERLRREKFEGAVLTLDSNAGVILEMARTSASNSRIVIFGIAGSIQEAMRFSKYGINAVIDKPVERQAALRVIRGTHLLVLNELRRYVRVPMVTAVNIETSSGKVTATTCEVSAGGMSLRTRGKLALMQEVEVGFDLPEALDIKVRATVCWVRPAEEMVGIRFERLDEQRQRVREWIDYYLGL